MGYETLVEVLKHLQGQHNQADHAGGKGRATGGTRTSKTENIPEQEIYTANKLKKVLGEGWTKAYHPRRRGGKQIEALEKDVWRGREADKAFSDTVSAMQKYGYEQVIGKPGPNDKTFSGHQIRWRFVYEGKNPKMAKKATLHYNPYSGDPADSTSLYIDFKEPD